MRTSLVKRRLLLLLVLLMLVAACGGGIEEDAEKAAEPSADETAGEDATAAETAMPTEALADQTGATAEPTSTEGADETAVDDGPLTIDDIEPLAEPMSVRLAITQSQILTVPMWMAISNGWFEQVGLNVQPDIYRGSSNEQIPRMATGEIDMSIATPSPALFNQLGENFGIQVIASLGEEMPGRISAAWLTVLADQADEIQELEDMAGTRVEGARIGSPPALLLAEALQQAGLTEEDVELTYRVQAPPDMFALAEAGAADVIGMNEPLATQAADAGLVVKWQSIAEVMPWFQPGLLAVAPEFLEANPEVVQKFLEVYVLASRLVNTAEGEWTDDIVTVVEENLDTPVDDFTAQGGVPFFSPEGEVSIESLERVQEIYLEGELLQEGVDPADLVAEEPLAGAVEALGG